MKNSLIIVSGGMDSITLLHEYKDSIAMAITFDYGSNHAKKEIPFAKLHCERSRTIGTVSHFRNSYYVTSSRNA